MKKKFNLYCTLLFIAISLGMVLESLQIGRVFYICCRSGYEAVIHREMNVDFSDKGVSAIEVLPKNLFESTSDSIVNTKTGEKSPIMILSMVAFSEKGENSEVYMWEDRIFGFISYLQLALVVGFWVVFIKLVLLVNKGHVFEEKIESLLSWGGWIVFAIYVFLWVETLSLYLFNQRLFEFEQYSVEILNYPESALLYTAFGMLLMSQIFKIGRRMKEEQELTI
ncbi:MAG: DUF2975 domain-containing protein [Bacteroidaceae bacterium]|nr:DUF2975 domain-containing protein [Bacteroidaceae bacterium]